MKKESFKKLNDSFHKLKDKVKNDKKTNSLKLLIRWILTTIAVYLGWSVINYIIK